MTPPLPFTICLACQKQWPVFWKNLQILLRETGCCRETRRVYRSVFRRFARETQMRPCDIEKKDIDEFLYTLGRSRCSAQWLAMNISILRTVFDKCCGHSLLQHWSCPKRPWMLPSIRSEEEVQKLLAAVHQLQNGTNIREVQELLGHHNVITTLKYLRLIPVEITSPADRMNDILPSLPADAAIPPYAEDSSKNRHWFLGWFKTQLWARFNGKIVA